MSYFDKYGEEITKQEWEIWSKDRGYLRVGATELKNGRTGLTVVVSTVWNGMDTGSREIFESLVTRNGEDVDSRRYRSLDAATEGHNEWVGKHMMELGDGPKLVREIPAEET